LFAPFNNTCRSDINVAGFPVAPKEFLFSSPAISIHFFHFFFNNTPNDRPPSALHRDAAKQTTCVFASCNDRWRTGMTEIGKVDFSRIVDVCRVLAAAVTITSSANWGGDRPGAGFGASRK